MHSSAIDSATIQQQVAARADAWTRGDARGFTDNLQDDGTFTNLVGMVIIGREQFEQRVAEILATVFKGSHMQAKIRNLRFLRPDVALVDVDTAITRFQSLPPGVQAHDGVLHGRQLWVMSKEQGQWSMAAFHNVDLKVSPRD